MWYARRDSGFRDVQEIRRFVDADAPANVELCLGEWMGALVQADELFTRMARPNSRRIATPVGPERLTGTRGLRNARPLNTLSAAIK